MASVIKEQRGDRTLYRIAYRDGDKRRRFIRLGSVSQKDARAIASKVKALVSAKIAGEALEPSVATWLANLGDDLRNKLAEQGLCDKRQRAP